MTYKWLSSGQNPPRIPEFYSMTKIRKNTPVGKPIVSCNSGPTERISLLQPIAKKQESYIKDTSHFVNFITSQSSGSSYPSRLFTLHEHSPGGGNRSCLSILPRGTSANEPTDMAILLKLISRYRPLIEERDKLLFNKVTITKDHPVQDLLPPKRSRMLRKRGHDLQLPHIRTKRCKSSFINRYLFLKKSTTT